MREKARRIPGVLTDVEVSVDINIPYYYAEFQTVEKRAKYLSKMAEEFNDFIRDHRSQDHIRLYVNEIRKDLCSDCKAEWGTFTDEDGTFCAHCGEPVNLEQETK